MEEYFSETAAAIRLRIGVREVLQRIPLEPEQKKLLRKEFAEIWNAETVRLDALSPGASRLISGKNQEAKEEWSIMKLVSEVLGAEGMIEGGAIWRTCIRGSSGHPPRPARVLRVFYQVRQDIKDAVPIRTTLSKYAWSLYLRFND